MAPRFRRRSVVLVGLGLVGLAAASVLGGATLSSGQDRHPGQPSAAAPSCLAARLVDGACGALWGAALDVEPNGLVRAVTTTERTTGRRLDIVHTYHRWTDAFPTSTEKALSASGHLLLINWQPSLPNGVVRWSTIAAGGADQEIDRMAARMRAWGHPALVSFSHEPELSLAQEGTAEEFAAAFRHVVLRVRHDGATAIRWVWDMAGISDPVWLDRYQQFWPGDDVIDWIGWDPYNTSACRGRAWRTLSQLVNPLYTWATSHGHAALPEMLAEYGSVESPTDPGRKAAWLTQVPATVGQFPRLRALVYFDYPHPPGTCDWLIDTSRAAATAFGRAARSTPFAQSARVPLPG